MTMTDEGTELALAERTASDIDTELYDLLAERYTVAQRVGSLHSQVREWEQILAADPDDMIETSWRPEKASRRLSAWGGESEVRRKIAHYNDTMLPPLEAEVMRITGCIAPLEGEYVRRGRWHRYFWVTGSNGHIHREMTCYTCRPTTQFIWLTHLSDCDEREMVRQYGERACTECFPDAPTMPEWKQALADAKAADKTCEHSGAYVSQVQGADYLDPDWHRYVVAPHVECPCGWRGAITKSGKYRKHNREGS